MHEVLHQVAGDLARIVVLVGVGLVAGFFVVSVMRRIQCLRWMVSPGASPTDNRKPVCSRRVDRRTGRSIGRKDLVKSVETKKG